jgi:hypothetical protein
MYWRLLVRLPSAATRGVPRETSRVVTVRALIWQNGGLSTGLPSDPLTDLRPVHKVHRLGVPHPQVL